MKYYFWILGCAMNYSDSERIATILERAGYERTYEENEANLFVVISCSVRESAILRIYGKMKDIRARKDEGEELTTILTGCVLENDRKKLEKVFDVIIETKDIECIPNKLKDINDFTSTTTMVSGGSSDYFRVKPHYESSFRAFVPISTGCDNFCSYCAVPYTKGREKSRPTDEIVEEVAFLINSGYKEITLVGQNVNSYGHDITGNKNDNSPFINLLNSLDEIDGDHRIYFYSNHPKDMTNELIIALTRLKHFPHYIHLPLQSGNNEILKEMNRHNTREDYLELVSKIRKAIPDVTLTTDIIVGYPGERDEQLADTAEVMKEAEFDMAFIAQYSPRSGTVSAKKVDDVTRKEKKRREAILQEIVKKTVLVHNQKLVSSTQIVLIDEQKDGKYYGRTEGYKVVEIKTDQPLQVGQFIDVKIDRVCSWKLFGSVTQQSSYNI
jgi:tRNA-2-methylthio-N6-dimethylallyladenosine synthase